MAELKTKQTEASVDKFLDTIEDISKREDCFKIAGIMEKESGYPAKMWGPGIIGYGSYHYKYESGHEGDICLIGFSPRKQSITLYIMAGLDDQQDLFSKLGKHKTSKGCLYIKKLSDIDVNILKRLITISIAYLKNRYK